MSSKDSFESLCCKGLFEGHDSLDVLSLHIWSNPRQHQVSVSKFFLEVFIQNTPNLFILEQFLKHLLCDVGSFSNLFEAGNPGKAVRLYLLSKIFGDETPEGRQIVFYWMWLWSLYLFSFCFGFFSPFPFGRSSIRPCRVFLIWGFSLFRFHQLKMSIDFVKSRFLGMIIDFEITVAKWFLALTMGGVAFFFVALLGWGGGDVE